MGALDAGRAKVNWMWFVRMGRWARNPPSMGRVKLVLGVVAVCAAIAAVQWLGLWPDFLTLPVKGKIPKP